MSIVRFLEPLTGIYKSGPIVVMAAIDLSALARRIEYVQIGGVFFKRIEEFNKIEGRFPVFSGTWLEYGESIDLVFDTP